MTGISHRAVSLLLVLLLHALLLAAFLRLMVTPHSIVSTTRERLLEMIIDTSRAPAPMSIMPRQTQPQRRGAPSATMPSFVLPFAPEAPDMKALGQAILRCAPENLPNLTPDQRAHCPNVFTRPDDSAVLEPRSRVKDPARRAAEMAAKNTPGHVPCTYITADAVQRQVAPALDLVCIADGLFGKGFAPLTGLPK